MKAPIPLALLLALLLAAPALAAERELFPTFSVRLGGVQLSSETNLGVDGETNVGGIPIDFENDFGLDNDDTVASIWLEWQPGERHLFRAAYYNTKRKGGRDLVDRSIEWGNVVYPIGASVSAELEQGFYELDWTWWLLKSDHAALGAQLGATVLELDASATARVQVGNVVREETESRSLTAPVPTIGFASRWQPFSQLWLEADARILPGVQVDNIDGDALIMAANAEWQAFKYFNLGLSVNRFTIDADVEEDDWNGNVDLTFDSFQLYGRFVF